MMVTMRSLERLIYQSVETGCTGSLLNMATILGVSQRNNDRAGLTGALGSHAGRFVQVLEGDTEALDRLMRRLVDDPRHRSIVIIDRKPVEARIFGAWSMASARFDPSQAARLDLLMARDHRPADILSIMIAAMTDDAGS